MLDLILALLLVASVSFLGAALGFLLAGLVISSAYLLMGSSVVFPCWVVIRSDGKKRALFNKMSVSRVDGKALVRRIKK